MQNDQNLTNNNLDNQLPQPYVENTTGTMQSPLTVATETHKPARKKYVIGGILVVAVVACAGFAYANRAGTPANVAAIVAGSSAPLLGSASAPSGYSLKWSDEFDGTSFNKDKWNIPTTNFGTGNKEDQCFLPQNATVANGSAVLTAKRVSPTTACGKNPEGNGSYYFTSSMLSTRTESGNPERYSFKKGYVEAKIKMPAGNPFWLGFWLVGGSGAPGWPAYGEMDITELVSVQPDLTTGTFHYAQTNGAGNANTTFANIYNMSLGTKSTCYMCSANAGAKNVMSGAMQQWHRYGLLWEDKSITWYVDGYPFRSLFSDGKLYEYYGPNATPKLVTKTAPNFDAKTFTYPHAILLTNSVGGSNPRYHGYTGAEGASGYNNGNLNVLKNVGESASTYIDYVRVYQLSGVSTPVSTQTTPTSTNNTSTGSTTPTTSATTPATLPVPTNIVAVAGNGQVELTWNAVTGADNYTVTWDKNADGTWDEYSNSATFGGSKGNPTTNKYTATGLMNGVKYAFSLRAKDSTGKHSDSAYSTASVIATPTQPTQTQSTTNVLSLPTNVKATPGAKAGQIYVTWTAVARANLYTVRAAVDSSYSNNPFYSNKLGDSHSPTAPGYTITGLQSGKKYYVSVRAKDSTLVLKSSEYTASVTAVAR